MSARPCRAAPPPAAAAPAVPHLPPEEDMTMDRQKTPDRADSAGQPAIGRRTLMGLGLATTAAALASHGRAAARQAGPAAPARSAALFGPDPGVALLSRNENPFGPAPSALAAIRETAAEGCYYANRGLERLRAMIAEHCRVRPEQVVLSSGSTEVLSAIALAFARKGTTVCPELFWDTTVRYGERLGGRVVRVPLGPDLAIDLEAMAQAVTAEVALVHLCNPNNPTGLLLPPDDLRAFIRRMPAHVTVLVDEAYNELTADPDRNSMLDLVREGGRVVVVRTFSKIYGMAGLRVGYALMPEPLAAEVAPLLMSFGGNTAGLAAAIASYRDEPFLAASRAAIAEAREMIAAAARRAGCPYLPSETNFLFIRVPDANALQKAMGERGILIRGAYGRFTEWARVSTGRPEDVRRFAAALPELVRA